MLELFFFLHSASYETIFDYRVEQDGFKMQGTSLKQFNFESGVLVHNESNDGLVEVCDSWLE